MAQIDRYIEAPYNGVSQAPPQVRLDNQAEAIEDTLLSVPQGALKRPPFEWQSRLVGHPGDPYGLFALVEREGTADVFVSLTNEAGVVVPRVYPLAGFAPQPVIIEPEAQAYLNQGNPVPAKDLVAVTVEDYTFLLNRKALVQKDPAFAPTRNKEAMVWVRQAAYGRSFTVTVSPADGDPVTATVKTPNGQDTTDAKYVDTEAIAAALHLGGPYTTANEGSVSGMLADLATQGFTVARTGPVIYFQAPAGVDFTVDVSDGQGGTAMLAVKDKVQRFADLPQKAVDGFTVRITQQSGGDSDDFFVNFTGTAGTGTGVWEETIGPGAELGLDPATMPVGLLFRDGSWRVEVLEWKQREVGDHRLAPDPDFVGSYLQDITFWRGRLALISGQAVTLSSAEDPLKLYPETLSSVLDSDTISLVSPLPGKGTLSRAVPFDSRLIVFADQGQAAVQAQGALRFDSASIDVAGGYEYSGPLRPHEVGERLYFLAPRGSQASVVYELTGGQDSEGKYRLTGDDRTAEVPRYIPAGIDRSAPCPVNYLVVYGRSGDRTLYPHLFRFADRQKVQNGWSRWWLPEGWALGGLAFQNTRMYVLATKDGQAHLVMADLAPERLDPHPSSTILTHLDFRVAGAVLPYPISPGSSVRVTVAAPGAEGYPEGMDLTGTAFPPEVPVWSGLSYASVIELSRFYALGADNRPLRAGRLSVRRVVADVASTGYLRAMVAAGNRPERSFEFTGILLDNPAYSLDAPPVVTAPFSFPVGASNESVRIRFVNDSHLPSRLLGLEWRGELNLKASRT